MSSAPCRHLFAGLRLFFLLGISGLLLTSAKGNDIYIDPTVAVGPTVQRWGWDIKAWPTRLNSTSEAEFLYEDVPANLLRVPIFATAHSENGSIDDSDYDTELDAMMTVQQVNPDVEIFASLKLQGGDTYPDWLGDATTAWPQQNGSIFGNTVERPNPEKYAGLVADYVEYLQASNIKIDYLGLNNETDGALTLDRYIATVDLLNAELVSRGVPEEYRSFKYVGPDTFGLTSAELIINNLDAQNRLDTVDVIASHFYPQHGSGSETSWTDIANITGGAPMWHTEVHMPIGHANYVNDRQQAYRDTLSLLFASNKRGVDSFVWWDSGHEDDKINDTIKRELVTTMIDGHAVDTTPGFTAKGDSDDEPLYQAYVQDDLMTLWLAYPDENIFEFIHLLGGARIISEPESIYWQGNSTSITGSNTGELQTLVGNNYPSEMFLLNLPDNATMFVQFRFALEDGDYDRDGDVDVDDYDLWTSTYGETNDLRADGNFDGIVDAADYTVLRDAYASIANTLTTAVPEPSSVLMMVAGLLAVCRKKRLV